MLPGNLHGPTLALSTPQSDLGQNVGRTPTHCRKRGLYRILRGIISQTMIIELCGLPGAGKTTVAEKLTTIHAVSLPTISGRTEVFFRGLACGAEHPRLFFSTLRHIFKNADNGKMFYYKVMNILLYRMAKYHKARASSGRVLLDEGPFQNILSLFERPVEREVLRAYVLLLPKPDLLVLLEISEEERAQRLAARKRVPRGDMSPEYRRVWNDAMEQNYATLLSLVDELGIDHIRTNDPLRRDVLAAVEASQKSRA